MNKSFIIQDIEVLEKLNRENCSRVSELAKSLDVTVTIDERYSLLKLVHDRYPVVLALGDGINTSSSNWKGEVADIVINKEYFALYKLRLISWNPTRRILKLAQYYEWLLKSFSRFFKLPDDWADEIHREYKNGSVEILLSRENAARFSEIYNWENDLTRKLKDLITDKVRAEFGRQLEKSNYIYNKHGFIHDLMRKNGIIGRFYNYHRIVEHLERRPL